MESAPGWLALVTGLVGRALALLPVRGLVVESMVEGSRLDLLPPMNGLGVTGRGLRTATGLAEFTPVRGPAVTGRGLLTATGLGLRTATELGVSVLVPMVARGVVVTGPGHAVPIGERSRDRSLLSSDRSQSRERSRRYRRELRSVWRLLLSPRLPLSLKRRQQWLLL